MRETETAQELFAWSRHRPFADSAFVWHLPTSLCIFLILNLFVTAARLGVGEQIGTRALNCCGMRIKTSKCWSHLACACEDRASRTRHQKSNKRYYRLEFCSSFPLDHFASTEIVRNKTFCLEQAKKLQEADSKANSSYENFKGILGRIDCGKNWTGHTYSATSTCRDCLEAYKDWICSTHISDVILYLDSSKTYKGPCLSLCKTVLKKCPYLPPTVPSDVDVDNVVQIGYSAFNCLGEKKWNQQFTDSEGCLVRDPMEKCKREDDHTATLQPTVTTAVAASNLTTNSITENGNR